MEPFSILKVDVVIPAWNVEEYISVLLDSLIPDTSILGRVVIVDNNSTDFTYDRALAWKSEHLEMDVLVVKERRSGACAARNKGLQYCSNEWVRFLDADDVIVAKSCTSLLEFASSLNVDFIYSHFLLRDVHRNEKLVKCVSEPLLAIASFRSGTTGSNLFRRKSFLEFGEWNEEMSSAQENELMHRWFRQGALCASFEQITYIHQSRNDNTQISSRNLTGRLRNRLVVVIETLQWIRDMHPEGQALEFILGEFFNAARKYYEFDSALVLEKMRDLGDLTRSFSSNAHIPKHYRIAYQLGGLSLASWLTNFLRKFY